MKPLTKLPRKFLSVKQYSELTGLTRQAISFRISKGYLKVYDVMESNGKRKPTWVIDMTSEDTTPRQGRPNNA